MAEIADDAIRDMRIYIACGLALLDDRNNVTLKDWELSAEPLKHPEFWEGVRRGRNKLNLPAKASRTEWEVSLDPVRIRVLRVTESTANRLEFRTGNVDVAWDDFHIGNLAIPGRILRLATRHSGRLRARA